ncbi:MAG: sigma-54 dependent transcriptional regulator [Spirochaetales bacterium]|nr:sigma-54 dependent transcriptional regulator [Spirochaetales bacterium]MCF7938795.1 sigma-54 dependent transcriptional regulator [Spirochaetales bacterium]
MRTQVFIVDDETEICRSLSEVLQSRGYQPTFCSEPDKAIDRIRENLPDIILLDIRMPGKGGIDLLKQIHEEFAQVPVIMISGYATVENAVKAMQYGAANLFTKPIKIPELLEEIKRLSAGKPPARETKPASPEIITNDPPTLKVLQMARTAAPTEATVLITGESGTGKELVANLLHQNSSRAKGPFLKINCAAIPENLLESELFGYEAGAFTDARTDKAGFFEAARGGTLFLDEIGDMSQGVQAKMLRVLQEKQFTRLGGTRSIRTDARIITATNRPIDDLLETTGFREDLYYRISVIHLPLKPLRERKEDIIPLSRYFLDYFGRQYQKEGLRFHTDVIEMLEQHSWPGNVRELKNLIERLVIFADSKIIDSSHLPEQYRYIKTTGQETGGDLLNMSREKSREVILEALSRAGGVKQEAARLLRINRKTLYNRMRKLGLLEEGGDR